MNKAKLMEDLKNALRSGEYGQAQEALYEGDNLYCCLGVADKVCFGATFSWGGFGYKDDHGYYDILSPERAEALGLNISYTPEELERAREFLEGRAVHMGVPILLSRQHLLYYANDAGATFSQIADLIEDLGWDREEA